MLVQAISSSSVFMSYSIVVAPMKIAFEPSNMVLMLGITVTIVAGGVLSPFIGTAIDRLSIRLLMLLGALMLAAGFFTLSLTTSMLQVLLVYGLLIAIGNVLLGQISASALVARWFARRRGLAMGIATSGVAVGGILVPPLLQLLMDSFDWRVALQIFSGILLAISAPVIALLVIDRPADRNLHPDNDSSPQNIQENPPAMTTRELVRNSTFWVLALVMAIVFFGPLALVSNLIPFVTNNGISAASGALLISIYAAASFFGKLLYAGFADRVDQRIALIGILMAMTVGIGGYYVGGSFSMLAAASVLTGLSSGAVLPLRSTLFAHIYGPDNLGRVLGLLSFFTLPFSLVAAPLFGFIYDRAQSYDPAFIGYAAMLVVCIVMLLRVRLSRWRPADSAANAAG